MYLVAPLDESTRTLLPLYVNTVGHDHIQEPRLRPQGAVFHHILAVEEGCGIFETKHGIIHIEAGTAVFLPKDYPVSYYGTDESFRTGWVTFDGSSVDNLLAYVNANPMQTCKSEDLSHEIKEFALRIRQSESPARMSVFLYEFLLSFFQASAKTENPHLEEAKKFIRTHAKQDLSVAQIAEAVGISPSLLYRLFREEGRTPVEYLKQVRIRKAKEHLLQPKKVKIGAVAAACGFSDVSYFCKVFREAEGISPKTFREHFRI